MVNYNSKRMYFGQPATFPRTFYEEASDGPMRFLNDMSWQTNAFGWLSGHVLDFIMRPNDELARSIDEQEAKYGFDFRQPCVG